MIVFVHGVPETAAVWRSVQGALDGPSVALSLPGFGCPRPVGFGATADDYVRWLVGELDAISEPVHLVGHDWGSALTVRVASAYGKRLRSWVGDVGNLAHPDYAWHAFAQLWQSPGEGEAFVASQDALLPQERAGGFEAMGVPPADALEMATAFDATMGACILDLYRSAVPNLHHRWGPLAPTTAPGLVLHPTEDPFSDDALASEVAAALGARFEHLPEAGHFWPHQAPEAAARLLEAFWASLV